MCSTVIGDQDGKDKADRHRGSRRRRPPPADQVDAGKSWLHASRQQDRFLQATAIYDVYAKRPPEIVATSRVEVPVSQAELAAGVGNFRHGQVSQWQAVFDGAYRAAAAAEPTLN